MQVDLYNGHNMAVGYSNVDVFRFVCWFGAGTTEL